MSYQTRHERSKWKGRPQSQDRIYQQVYSELSDNEKEQIDQRARREALKVIDQEERDQGGMYRLGVRECELELERHEQWERTLAHYCAQRIQELITRGRNEDGPEERLQWAMQRTIAQREPGYVRPKTIGEMIQRLSSKMGEKK